MNIHRQSMAVGVLTSYVFLFGCYVVQSGRHKILSLVIFSSIMAMFAIYRFSYRYETPVLSTDETIIRYLIPISIMLAVGCLGLSGIVDLPRWLLIGLAFVFGDAIRTIFVKKHASN